MYISQTAQYALRSMSCMATKPAGITVRAQDLSSETGIPIFYLSKIMRQLVKAGLLSSQKGHSGGFKLNRPLDEIYFADILKAIDTEFDYKKCVFGWGECSEESPCIMHTFWGKLKDNINSWAEQYTLYDVSQNADLLNQIDPY